MAEVKLFVGNLPVDVKEEEIWPLFEPFGTLQDVHIMINPRMRMNVASAFVRYFDRESCERAIAALHMKRRLRASDPEPMVVRFAKTFADHEAERAARGIAGKGKGKGTGKGRSREPSPVRAAGGAISSSPEASLHSPEDHPSAIIQTPPPSAADPGSLNCKLFVGGLPTFIGKDELIAVFTCFGPIESIHLMQGKSRSGQACAFVTFHLPSSAAKAISALDGRYRLEEGKFVMVRYAQASQRDHSTKRQKEAGNLGVPALQNSAAFSGGVDLGLGDVGDYEMEPKRRKTEREWYEW